jgi:multidrug efflux pump subunit AcrA (membrane-fusion protein)
MKKIILLIFFVLVIFAACGTAPPPGLSQGPELLIPTVGRPVFATVDRGMVFESHMFPGMVTVSSVPLFFETDTLPFEKFHVYPGMRVYEGQLLATLYTPQPREQLANQEAAVARLMLSHALNAEAWEIDYDLLHLRYLEQMHRAAENFDESAMEQAQQIYLDMATRRLNREQDLEWQRIELRDATNRLEEMRENLRGTNLLAPFDGIVTYTTALSHGASISVVDRIMFITPLDAPMFVELVAETIPNRANMVRFAGESGGITVELRYIPLTAEEVAYNALHNRPRRTRFAIPEHAGFALGATVRVFAYELFLENVLRVPINTLNGTTGSPYVYRLEQGILVPVHPEFGERTLTFIEVLEGLEEGDELYVR